VVLGGGQFLISEVPLYPTLPNQGQNLAVTVLYVPGLLDSGVPPPLPLNASADGTPHTLFPFLPLSRSLSLPTLPSSLPLPSSLSLSPPLSVS